MTATRALIGLRAAAAAAPPYAASPHTDQAQRMKFVVSRGNYRGQRHALLCVICPTGQCHHCGRGRRRLQFDHEGLRDFLPSRLNCYQRLRVYYREWIAAGGVVGKGIVGACPSCNQERGGGRSGGGKGRAYDDVRLSRRARRGTGYSTADYIAYCQQQRDRAEEIPF